MASIESKAKMVKARLEEEDGAKSLEFTFNPTEYSVTKSATWEKPPRSQGSKAGAKPNYVGSSPQAVSMQIFFDDWEALAGDVTKPVEQLIDWCTPSRKSVSDKKPQPPLLKFLWGTNPHLMAQRFYLESVNAKYTMFRRDGTPVRATADIKLSEVPTGADGQNPTSGSIHTRRTHVIGQGDTLQSIAQREYGQPGLWRGLATFNEIDDPLRLNIGSTILLPSLEETAVLVR